MAYKERGCRAVASVALPAISALYQLGAVSAEGKDRLSALVLDGFEDAAHHERLASELSGIGSWADSAHVQSVCEVAAGKISQMNQRRRERVAI